MVPEIWDVFVESKTAVQCSGRPRPAGDRLSSVSCCPTLVITPGILHCTALRCTALHCTALHCTAKPGSPGAPLWHYAARADGPRG